MPNVSEYTGNLAYTPRLRDTQTTKVINFALKCNETVDGAAKWTGCNCTAWANMAERIASATLSDEITVKGYLMKTKIYPEVLNPKTHKPIYETVLVAKEVTIAGHTARQEMGDKDALPFDL